jgi:hypothetical protein
MEEVKVKEKVLTSDKDWEGTKEAAELGAAKILAQDFSQDITEGGFTGLSPFQTLKGNLKGRWFKTKNTWNSGGNEGTEKARVKAVGDVVSDIVKNISNTAISFTASLDNSFLGRQGMTTLMTHPKIWYDMFKKSWTDIGKSMRTKHGAENVRRAMMAEVYSRNNHRNGYYDLAGLIPKTEEQYPTSAPSSVPYIGRAFKASQNAFLNSAIRARINTFDLIMKEAKLLEKEGGLVINENLIKDIGMVVNSATARGKTGAIMGSPLVTNLLWAPKMLKANWDVLTMHSGGTGLNTKFAKQQAAKNLGKMAAVYIGLATILNALNPGMVETDPRSTDFMKIRIGQTRIDLSGGKGSVATLLARVLLTISDGFRITNEMGGVKNPETGEIVELNNPEKYKGSTLESIGVDFLRNKLTPFARVAVDRARGETFEGETPYWATDVIKLASPISAANFVKTFYDGDSPDTAVELVGNVADVVGLSSTTYKNKFNKKSGGLEGLKGIEGLKGLEGL